MVFAPNVSIFAWYILQCIHQSYSFICELHLCMDHIHVHCSHELKNSNKYHFIDFFLWYITHSECMVIEFTTITMGSCTRCDLVPRNPLIYTFITLSLCMQIACDTTNAIYKFNLVHADSLMLQDIGLDASISCFTANPQDNPKVTYIHFAESTTLSVN